MKKLNSVLIKISQLICICFVACIVSAGAFAVDCLPSIITTNAASAVNPFITGQQSIKYGKEARPGPDKNCNSVLVNPSNTQLIVQNPPKNCKATALTTLEVPMIACNTQLNCDSFIFPGTGFKPSFCQLSCVNSNDINGAVGNSNTYTVGGSISGLIVNGFVTDNLILQLSNVTTSTAQLVTVTQNTNYIFANALESGSQYNATVFQQPTGQNCTVSNGSGTIGTTSVTNVNIACTPNFYVLSVIASGIIPGGLFATNNGTDMIPIPGVGFYPFMNPVAFNASYNVTTNVPSVPPPPYCIVAPPGSNIMPPNNFSVVITCF